VRRILATAILSLTILACTPSAAANATPAPTATPTATCDRACWTAIVARQKAERAWWAEVVAGQRRRAEAARIARTYAYAHAIEQARLARLAAASGGRIIDGIEVCNGRDLPTCAIVHRESRFNPRAENPTSSASGLYQFIDGTWRTCGTGYGHASYAPVAVQVACARRIWNGGRGRGHWSL